MQWIRSRCPIGRQISQRISKVPTVSPIPSKKFSQLAHFPKKLSENPGFLNDIDVVIFDCDGVIWKGDTAIDGVANTLLKLRKKNKKIYFATNNSTKSRKSLKEKLNGMDIEAYDNEVFSSSFAAAAYLTQKNFQQTGKKVYVIGEKGIGDELTLAGIPFIGGPSHATLSVKPPSVIIPDENIGAVVVGFDASISYYKIQYAQLCINHLNCEFIATNLDETANRTPCQKWAAGGAMVGAIKGCTGIEPTVVGKPSSLMVDYITDDAKTSRSRMCMVGDRLDTDVLFGLNHDLKTVLTLSGVTTKEKLFSPQNKTIPHFYADTINDFIT